MQINNVYGQIKCLLGAKNKRCMSIEFTKEGMT